MKAARVNDYDIIKERVTIEKINKLLALLEFIKSRGCLDFLKDSAHNGIIQKKNIEEALVGIAAIDQGFYAILKRSEQNTEEYIDIFGNRLDVKKAGIKLKDGKYIYDQDKTVSDIQEALKDGEKILLNISDLEDVDLQNLTKRLRIDLSEVGIKDVILIDYKDIKRSTRLG